MKDQSLSHIEERVRRAKKRVAWALLRMALSIALLVATVVVTSRGGAFPVPLFIASISVALIELWVLRKRRRGQ